MLPGQNGADTADGSASDDRQTDARQAHLQPQQTCGVATDDQVALGPGQAGDTVDQAEGVGHAHVIGIVGPEEDVVGAVPGHQETELVGGEHHRVEVEHGEVLTGWAGQAVTHVLTGVIGMVEAPGIHGQEPAAVGEDELEVGESLHDAVEDEPAGADGLLQRVADRVDEVVVHEPLRLGEPGRVEEDHEPELFDLRPEVVEPRAGDLDALDVRRHLDAPETELVRTAPQFGDGLGRVLHRDRAEGEETVGVIGRDLGQVVVDGRERPNREVDVVDPVVQLIGGEAQGLDVDSHLVHGGDPDVDRLHDRAEDLQLFAVYLTGQLVPHLEGAAAQPFGLRFHQRRGSGAFPVAMDVDHPLPAQSGSVSVVVTSCTIYSLNGTRISGQSRPNNRAAFPPAIEAISSGPNLVRASRPSGSVSPMSKG